MASTRGFGLVTETGSGAVSLRTGGLLVEIITNGTDGTVTGDTGTSVGSGTGGDATGQAGGDALITGGTGTSVGSGTGGDATGGVGGSGSVTGGTGTSVGSGTGGDATGGVGGSGSVTGGTGTSTGSGAGGDAVGGSNTGSITVGPMENAPGFLWLSQAVKWTWTPAGRTGSMSALTPVDGVGTTHATTGELTVTGLPLGIGVMDIAVAGATPADDLEYRQHGAVM